jgi:hypothetical protein
MLFLSPSFGDFILDLLLKNPYQFFSCLNTLLLLFNLINNLFLDINRWKRNFKLFKITTVETLYSYSWLNSFFEYL